jgi:hypothetical protein
MYLLGIRTFFSTLFCQYLIISELTFLITHFNLNVNTCKNNLKNSGKQKECDEKNIQHDD